MRIAFSGPQSSGKTTLLQELKKTYSSYHYIDEVTRLVKKSYGVHINEAGGTETQLYILAEHIKNHLLPYENLILDRCVLDGYVYTKYQVSNGKVDFKVLDAFKDCFGLLFDKLDYVFYTDPKDVDLEDDGERSVNQVFREDIIEIFENILEYKLSEAHKAKIIKLSGTVEQRLEIIKQILK
jgi:thymidylate kinase